MLFLTFPYGAVADEPPDTCDYFYRQLADIPLHRITYEKDVMLEDLEGGKFHGCKVTFNSDIELMKEDYELPSFMADDDTELFEKGWRNNNRYGADGAGSGKYGIIKNDILCIVDWSRHAWLDETTRKITQSDLINMEIRCLDKRKP